MSGIAAYELNDPPPAEGRGAGGRDPKWDAIHAAFEVYPVGEWFSVTLEEDAARRAARSVRDYARRRQMKISIRTGMPDEAPRGQVKLRFCRMEAARHVEVRVVPDTPPRRRALE